VSASDYLIVGGGVYGCGLAWELASAGFDVTLLEKGSIASGSSGGSGARGVRADRRDLRELRLAKRALDRWPELDERLGAETGYIRIGGLRLVEHEYVGGAGGRVSLDAHARMQNRIGITTEVLAREELAELEPGLDPRVTHAIFVPDDGVAPQSQTTLALASAARLAGAELIEGMRVLGLTWSGARVTGVLTGDGTHTARKAVVIAANADSGSILGEERELVVGWSVVPQTTFIAPQAEHTIRHLINHESRPLSLKPGPDGTVQVSGGLRGRWNAELGKTEVDEDRVVTALADASAVYPELTGAAVMFSEAIAREHCSPDGIPVIDLVPGSENLFVATMWTSHGFALFPAVVEALRDWLISGHQPSLLHPFGVWRFDP
jgi:sarcosine oxidase, subunit beta